MHVSKRKIVGLILVILLLALFILVWQAGNFLVINQAPQKADVIIILGGDTGIRVEQGVELYQKGYADAIIVSGGQLYHQLTQAEAMKEHAVALGVPVKAVFMEPKAESTYDNALYSKQIMMQQNFTSAIVVTSNYHTRRSKFIFDKVFRDTNITLTYCAAPEPNFVPERWWANNKSIMFTLTEYIKFLGYAVGKNI